MKQDIIKNCGECKYAPFDHPTESYCAKGILVVNPGILHPDCPLSDLPESPNAGLAGLRGYINIAIKELQKSHALDIAPDEDRFRMSGAIGAYKDVLIIMSEIESSPDVPAQAVRAKRIEWKYFDNCQEWWGTINPFIIRIVQNMLDNKFYVMGNCGALSGYIDPSVSYDTLELAQIATQMALDEFVEKLVE